MAMIASNKPINGFGAIYTEASKEAKLAHQVGYFGLGTIGNIYGAYKGYQNSPNHPILGVLGGMSAGGGLTGGAYNLATGIGMALTKKNIGAVGLSAKGHAVLGAGQMALGALFGYGAW